MRTCAFMVGASSGRIVTLMIVRSSTSSLDWTVTQYCRKLPTQFLSLVSCAIRARTGLSRAEFSESTCILYSIHVRLALAMCRSSRMAL